MKCSRPATILAFLVLVLLLVGVGVAVTNTQRSSPSEIGAPELTPDTPAPTEAADEPPTLPPTPPAKFVGSVNGISFVEPEALPAVSSISPKCTGSNVRYGTESDLTRSSLDFEVGYLPTGSRLKSITVSLCEDEVIAATKEFEDARGGLVQVFRRRGPPIISNESASQSLRPATLRGRASAIGERVLYMRDDSSVWVLTIMGADSRELEKVASGMK